MSKLNILTRRQGGRLGECAPICQPLLSLVSTVAGVGHDLGWRWGTQCVFHMDGRDPVTGGITTACPGSNSQGVSEEMDARIGPGLSWCGAELCPRLTPALSFVRCSLPDPGSSPLPQFAEFFVRFYQLFFCTC